MKCQWLMTLVMIISFIGTLILATVIKVNTSYLKNPLTITDQNGINTSNSMLNIINSRGLSISKNFKIYILNLTHLLKS